MAHDHPSKRPGMLTDVAWLGEDDDLSMVVDWSDDGSSGSVVFQLQNMDEGQVGTICLPASSDLDCACEDSILASIRMRAFLASAIAGSGEFLDLFAVIGGADIRAAVGNFRIDSVEMVDSSTFNINLKRGADSLTILTDHRAVSNYSYAPSTQLLVIAGSVRSEFPSYIHDYPTHVLTQGQRDDIEAYVLGLELWV